MYSTLPGEDKRVTGLAEGETRCGRGHRPTSGSPGTRAWAGVQVLLGPPQAGPLTALQLFLAHEAGMMITEPRSGLSRRGGG